MAYGSLDFYSECLKRTVTFKFILPNETDDMTTAPMRLLLLLHGYNGTHTDWMLNSKVLEFAVKYHMCIVMPTGENSFYLDGEATGRKYAAFIGEELPNYIRKTFPVSDLRSETYIGGFSMGGFGALHTAFKYSETFGKVFALSSALIIHEVKNMKPGKGNDIADYEYYRLMFGQPERLEISENNPEELIRQLLMEEKEIPQIFMACGTSDFLLENNREFADFLKENGVEHTYLESEGDHNFEFWNAYLDIAMKWLL